MLNLNPYSNSLTAVGQCLAALSSFHDCQSMLGTLEVKIQKMFVELKWAAAKRSPSQRTAFVASVIVPLLIRYGQTFTKHCIIQIYFLQFDSQYIQFKVLNQYNKVSYSYHNFALRVEIIIIVVYIQLDKNRDITKFMKLSMRVIHEYQGEDEAIWIHTLCGKM